MTLSTKNIAPAPVATQATLSVEQANIITDLVLGGDLSKMNGPARVSYYVQLCQSLSLNPHTQPFQILKFQGKEIMYATKSCTEQLRKLWGVSVTNIEARKEGDVYLVVASVTDSTGRTDAASGVVSLIDGRGNTLTGENLANAFMKAETKAKRRATLSICGLGMLDESELDTMPQATRVSLPAEIGTSATVVEEAAAPAAVMVAATTPAPTEPSDEVQVEGHRTRLLFAKKIEDVQQIWGEVPKHLKPQLVVDKEKAKNRFAQPPKPQPVRDEQLMREFVEQPTATEYDWEKPAASEAQREEIKRLINLQTITPAEKADMLKILYKLDEVRAGQAIFKILNELAVREGRDANKEMRQALHRFTTNYGQQLGAEEVDRLRLVADDKSLHWQQVRAELLLAKESLTQAVAA
jgi:23S rRNA pseudoU1915 N3-methylase RlmH